MACADMCVQREVNMRTIPPTTRDTGGQLAQLASSTGVDRLKLWLVVMVVGCSVYV